MDVYEAIERARSRAPHQPFLATRERNLSYSQALDLAASLAGSIATAGALDRPCVIQAIEIDACISVLACLRLGKPFIVINPASPPDRIDYYITDSGANVLVKTAESGLVASSLPCDDQGWRTAVEPASSVSCLIYTSGSTGLPKAVVCPREAVSFAVEAIAQTLSYRRDDVVLTALPTFFDFGLYQLFLVGKAGATLYFASALESGLGLGEALQRTGATVLPMVPPAAEKLARLVERGLSRNAVRMITTTGAAMDEGTRRTLEDAWDPPVDLRVMYGLTECKRVAIMPPYESTRRPRSSGLPLPGTTVTIRPHDQDLVLSPDEVGEICVEGPHVMGGYHNQSDLTARRFRRTSHTVVLRTGDTGFLDADGYLYCLGRDDDQFKVQGYRISTSEVVAAAKAAGGVVSAAVVPPAPGRRYTLFFEGDAEPAALSHFLSEHLEPFAIPQHIQKVAHLPTNANGKIDITQLERTQS